MAYATGTVSGIKNLFDSIVAFATGNGWTLLDTLNNGDKVLRSTGTSGDRNLVYRVQAQPRYLDVSGVSGTFAAGDTVTGGTSGNTATVVDVAPAVLTLIDNNGMFQAGEALTAAPSGATATVVSRVRYDTILAPNFIQNAADNIVVRGYNYWNTGTDTGTNEYSRYGKLNVVYSNSNTPLPIYAVPGATTKAPLRGYTNDYYVYAPPGSPSNYDVTSGFNVFNQFDGRRAIVGPTGGSWGGRHVNYDLSEGVIQENSGWPYFNPTNQNRGLCLAFDKAQDNWYRYYDQRPNGGAANYFWRWDWNTNGSTPVASNSAYGSDGYYTKLCWDGDAYIYMLNGNSTSFGRYNISTNTWDAPGTLANCPGTNNRWSPPHSAMFYIPKGAISGSTSDEVWVCPDNSSLIYRYNVNSNSWSSIASPTNYDQQPSWAWDNERYVYWYYYNNTQGFRLDLQNIAGGWVSISVSPANLGQNPGFWPFNQFSGNIRGLAQQPITYWIVGDADTITVVTKVVGNYYWCQFGLADTFYSDFVATLTAPASVGSPATVTVDDTSGLITGQEALAFDPATGVYTKITVYQVTSGTTFTAFLGTGLASGVQISTDHNCNVVTSDCHFANMASDGSGFYSDAPDLQPSYRVIPAAPQNWLGRGGPTTRQTYETWPLIVYQNFPGLETYENRAKLRQISVTRKVTGGPQSEDIIKVGSNQYIVFYPENYEYTVDNQYLIAIGPI